MSFIRRDFVDRRVSPVERIPSEWEVSHGHYYQLDMKMCQIHELKYDFRWGDDQGYLGVLGRGASITDHPAKILVLNVSLNDLMILGHEGLAPFSQLRVLDASLNRIKNFMGVEVSRYLYSLNLSHNHISGLDGLQNLQCLAELNLGMNRLDSITNMPCMTSLSVLHLNNNQLKSLDGIQSLSGLKELFVQRNQLTNIVPLSTTLRLTVLHAADNQISSFYTTLDVVRGLKRLEAVCFYGNPIEKENNYQSQMLQSTSIITLDNISVKPQLRETAKNNNIHSSNLLTIKEATRQAFHDQMREQRIKMEESVRFLQGRIKALHEEHQDYEGRMQRELDTCLRYLDGLNAEEANHYNVHSLRDNLRTPTYRPWEQPYIKRDPSPFRLPPGDSLAPVPNNKVEPKRTKEDYKDIKDTDEVLRHACNELARDKGQPNT